MLEPREAAAAYAEVLNRLRRLEATELIADVEAAVAAGALRAGPRKGQSRRVELSPVEQLELVVRLLLARVEPLLMIAEARKVFGRTYRPRLGGRVPRVVWEPDALDRDPSEDGMGPPSGRYASPAQELPSFGEEQLRELVEAAKKLQHVLAQLGAGAGD